jgi:hypothetical protein
MVAEEDRMTLKICIKEVSHYYSVNATNRMFQNRKEIFEFLNSIVFKKKNNGIK